MYPKDWDAEDSTEEEDTDVKGIWLLRMARSSTVMLKRNQNSEFWKKRGRGRRNRNRMLNGLMTGRLAGKAGRVRSAAGKVRERSCCCRCLGS